jgi:L-rhamnose mutarotase
MEENKQGYPVREYHEPVKRYCRTLDLRNDAELIRRYREAHSEEKM